MAEGDRLPTEIALAIEENMAALLAYCATATKGQVHDSPDLFWTLTDAASSFLNAVVRTRWPAMPEDELNAAIESLLARYRERQRPFVWWVWPSTSPATLGEALASCGLTYRGEGPGMAMSLANLPANHTLDLTEGLSIEEVNEHETLAEWLGAMNVAYGEDADNISAEKLAREALLGLPEERAARRYRRYLARLDGAPVATAFTFVHAGAVGLYGVTTIPQARRRGIGAAVSLAALVAAQNDGCQFAVLESSPLGEPVYRQLGFREASRIRSYVWEP